MESQILALIREEVAHQVALQLECKLERISHLYDIPIERLIKDTNGVEANFCKGILKNRTRCLKKPFDNGYCGFHQKQNPNYQVPEEKKEEETSAPWDE